MSWLALDIGGANLKASDGNGYSVATRFALWEQPGRLASALASMIEAAPCCDRIAVTMTGELADCYATRLEGIRSITAAAQSAANGRRIFLYLTDGQLLPPEQVWAAEPLFAAASNWHAAATFAARYSLDQPAIWIDAGSTTIDLIPIVAGQVAGRGRTDVERLIHGELVYTGVERSPICAVATALPYQGFAVPVAQELFATTVDAYLLLGQIAEDHANCTTADGRPRTREFARLRLGRSICTELTEEEAVAAAQEVRRAQIEAISTAFEKVASAMAARPKRLLLSGHGDFLVRQTIDQIAPTTAVVAMAEELGPAASRCITAHALANLAREQIGP